MAKSAEAKKKQNMCGLKGCLARVPLLGRFVKKPVRVSVLRLSGIIADSTIRRKGLCFHKLKKHIDKAFDKADGAVCLIINSPGGSPAQSSLISDYLCSRAGEKTLPVFAFVEDLAASGGYWIACSCDKIYVQPSSIVGSIGVISSSFGLEKFIEKHDIKRRVYTSGTQKSFLDPFLEENAKDVKRLTAIQKEIHEGFINWVKKRRGKRLKAADKELFEGQFWVGAMAVENGIADSLGDIYTKMKERFGDNVKFIEIETEKKMPFPLQLISAKPGFSEEDFVEHALSGLENKLLWSRYGL
jgi:signal peptide peptidase SppA